MVFLARDRRTGSAACCRFPRFRLAPVWVAAVFSAGPYSRTKNVDPRGLEPLASALQERRST
jgi:hypothetical protein